VGERAALVGLAMLLGPLGQAGQKAMGQSAAQHCAPRFLIFVFFYNSRNSYKPRKYVENTIRLRKIQNKLL
jgi:hypothetical protein